MGCSHERLLGSKIKQFSSSFHVCVLLQSPKIILFDHINPEDGSSKLENFVNFLPFHMASYSWKLESSCFNVVDALFQDMTGERVGLGARKNLFAASAYSYYPSLRHGWTTTIEGEEKCHWLLQGQKRAAHHWLWHQWVLHHIGNTGINPEVENWLKYLVSSDANILNESMLIFQWECCYNLTVVFSKVQSIMKSWHVSDGFCLSGQHYKCLQ